MMENAKALNDSAEQRGDDHFGQDGSMTKAIEEIPLIGFIRSAIHAQAGDGDRAIRAAAKCSSSTIHAGTMLAASIATGGLGFLPTLALGAVAGGVGLASELAIKQNIEDDDIKAHCVQPSAKDLMLTAGFGSAFALVGGAGGSIAKGMMSEVGRKGASKHAAGFVTGQTVNQLQVAPVKREVKEIVNKVVRNEEKHLMARHPSEHHELHPKRTHSHKRRHGHEPNLARPRKVSRRRNDKHVPYPDFF